MALDSPVFTPQQFYLIGFAQDSWRVDDRLTLELGLRYDFYSVVKEKDDRAKPFFIEDNAFGSDAGQFLQSRQEQLRAAAVGGLPAQRQDGAARAASACSTAPASSRIASSRSRTTSSAAASSAADVPNNGLAYPVDPAVYRNLLSIRGYTHERPDEYNVQYGVSLAARAARRDQPDASATRAARGKDMFLRGVGNTLDFTTRSRRRRPSGQVDYKTSGCVDGLVINGNRSAAAGAPATTRCRSAPTRRFRGGLYRRLAVSVLAQQGHDAGLERGGDDAEHVRLRERSTARTRRTFRTPFNGSLVYLFPGEGLWNGGWRVGGIVNARSGVPINVTIARADNVTINGVTVTNIPGGN